MIVIAPASASASGNRNGPLLPIHDFSLSDRRTAAPHSYYYFETAVATTCLVLATNEEMTQKNAMVRNFSSVETPVWIEWRGRMYKVYGERRDSSFLRIGCHGGVIYSRRNQPCYW